MVQNEDQIQAERTGHEQGEEQCVTLELYMLEPMLEKAVPHDRQNKQTKAM